MIRPTFAVTALVTLLLTLHADASALRAQDPDVLYLKQGWTAKERDTYYHIPQGSELIPYRWFMALERSGGRPFRDTEHLTSYWFIPSNKNESNPAGLPVGFTKSPREAGGHWLGLTCAACHTTEMEVDGARLRVDGGTNLLDVLSFQAALDDSVKETLADKVRFERFATKVLGADAAKEAIAKLRSEVAATSKELSEWRSTSAPAHATGQGHWDAVNILLNSITAKTLKEPANYRTPQTPVSYPSIWLTNQADRLLWNASVESVTLRQVGEVIIVFGRAEVSLNENNEYSFDTSADLLALEKVYEYTKRLEPPRWPEELLGKLDQEKVARGAKLYAQKCAECHSVYDRDSGYGLIKTHPTSIKDVKTDPLYAQNFVARTAKPALLAPMLKKTMFKDKKEVPAAILFLATLTQLTVAELDATAKNDAERERLLGGRPLPKLPENEQELATLVNQLLVYKAAPLPGVWASAPYLHNGSVPNLYELLSPQAKRSKSFTLGNREFDAKNIGYKKTGGGYRYDTTLPGNSNQGHEYGAELNANDRWALIEYLKSL